MDLETLRLNKTWWPATQSVKDGNTKYDSKVSSVGEQLYH